MSVTLFHNPRCSKSRQTLELLRDRGIEPEIIEYLKTPPDRATLEDLARKLGIRPKDLLRKKEAAFSELGLADKLDDDAAVLSAMEREPVLMERPIVVCGDRARIGRPPEKVLEILE